MSNINLAAFVSVLDKTKYTHPSSPFEALCRAATASLTLVRSVSARRIKYSKKKHQLSIQLKREQDLLCELGLPLLGCEIAKIVLVEKVAGSDGTKLYKELAEYTPSEGTQLIKLAEPGIPHLCLPSIDLRVVVYLAPSCNRETYKNLFLDSIVSGYYFPLNLRQSMITSTITDFSIGPNKATVKDGALLMLN